MDYLTGITYNNIKGQKDWYVLFSEIKRKLEKEESVDPLFLNKILLSHLLEMLIYSDLLNLLKYIYLLPKLTNFEQKIKDYFDSKLMVNKMKNITGLLVQGWSKKTAKPIQQLLILNGKTWKIAESEKEGLLEQIKENVVLEANLDVIVGFITTVKNEYMTFKSKLISKDKKRNTGSRCEQSQKPEIIKALNEIIGREKYTPENTKSITRSYLCVLQEVLLRLNNYKKKDKKTWFVNPAQAVIIEHPEK